MIIIIATIRSSSKFAWRFAFIKRFSLLFLLKDPKLAQKIICHDHDDLTGKFGEVFVQIHTVNHQKHKRQLQHFRRHSGPDKRQKLFAQRLRILILTLKYKCPVGPVSEHHRQHPGKRRRRHIMHLHRR